MSNQLIQVNQRPSPLLPQVVVRCALNFKTKSYYYYSYCLLFCFKVKKQLGLPFQGEIELADMNIYVSSLNLIVSLIAFKKGW